MLLNLFSFTISFLVDIVQAQILSIPSNTLTRFVTDIVSSKNSNDINLEVDSERVITYEQSWSGFNGLQIGFLQPNVEQFYLIVK
ncbi:unnamed protein product [Rotaria sp. Silwood2]|nr:unnamed protein product [Rotaria sp. Silwood2]